MASAKIPVRLLTRSYAGKLVDGPPLHTTVPASWTVGQLLDHTTTDGGVYSIEGHADRERLDSIDFMGELTLIRKPWYPDESVNAVYVGLQQGIPDGTPGKEELLAAFVPIQRALGSARRDGATAGQASAMLAATLDRLLMLTVRLDRLRAVADRLRLAPFTDFVHRLEQLRRIKIHQLRQAQRERAVQAFTVFTPDVRARTLSDVLEAIDSYDFAQEAFVVSAAKFQAHIEELVRDMLLAAQVITAEDREREEAKLRSRREAEAARLLRRLEKDREMAQHAAHSRQALYAEQQRRDLEAAESRQALFLRQQHEAAERVTEMNRQAEVARRELEAMQHEFEAAERIGKARAEQAKAALLAEKQRQAEEAAELEAETKRITRQLQEERRQLEQAKKDLEAARRDMERAERDRKAAEAAAERERKAAEAAAERERKAAAEAAAAAERNRRAADAAAAAERERKAAAAAKAERDRRAAAAAAEAEREQKRKATETESRKRSRGVEEDAEEQRKRQNAAGAGAGQGGASGGGASGGAPRTERDRLRANDMLIQEGIRKRVQAGIQSYQDLQTRPRMPNLPRGLTDDLVSQWAKLQRDIPTIRASIAAMMDSFRHYGINLTVDEIAETVPTREPPGNPTAEVQEQVTTWLSKLRQSLRHVHVDKKDRGDKTKLEVERNNAESERLLAMKMTYEELVQRLAKVRDFDNFDNFCKLQPYSGVMFP